MRSRRRRRRECMFEAFEEDRSARYAWSAGAPGPGPNRHRLSRDMVNGKIAGVCAGLADYFDINVKWIRIGWILAAIFLFPAPIFIYAVAALVMKQRRYEEAAAVYESEDDARFWRSFNARPRATYAELKHRFRALDARIAEMEHAVTSDEYALRREFRDLERGAGR